MFWHIYGFSITRTYPSSSLYIIRKLLLQSATISWPFVFHNTWYENSHKTSANERADLFSTYNTHLAVLGKDESQDQCSALHSQKTVSASCRVSRYSLLAYYGFAAWIFQVLFIAYNYKQGLYQRRFGDIPSNYEAFTQCCVNVGPPSPTLAQHWNSIQWKHRSPINDDTSPLCNFVLYRMLCLATWKTHLWLAVYTCTIQLFNPLTAKLFNLNFHPLEVVSRWRDPQLRVSENYSDLTKWRSTNFKSCWLLSLFIFNMFKSWYVMC